MTFILNKFTIQYRRQKYVTSVKEIMEHEMLLEIQKTQNKKKKKYSRKIGY